MQSLEQSSSNLNRFRIETLSQRKRWDEFIQSKSYGCFMQSWVWGEFKELEGYQVFRYGIFAQEKLVGCCAFYYYPHPGKANLLLAPGGPLLPEIGGEEALQLLLEIARNLAQKLGAIALRIEPMITHKPPYFQDFVPAPVEAIPSETLLIDLRPPIQEIFQGMKPKGRYNIRLSQKRGVEIEFTTDLQKIPIFYDIFWETCQRQQFLGEPYGFFINLCQTLIKANMAEIALAKWKGQILASLLLVYWGERTIYLYGGSLNQYREVMAPYSLHWEAIQRAKAKGFIFYDFYGFTQDPHHNYAKFSRFKRQFGGFSQKIMGAHDYLFYDQLADTLITLFYQLGGAL